MIETGVHVIVGDAALGRALTRRIARAPGFSVALQNGAFEEVRAGEVILTTPSDCSLVQCDELVGAGVQVVLLSPVPREAERANYVLIGARYLAMRVDTEELFVALTEASAVPRPGVQ
ncbi:MAG: hypothetical protein ABI939_07665 [Anaerolineaceae bacterium]